MNSPEFGVTPLGVAIAKKQLECKNEETEKLSNAQIKKNKKKKKQIITTTTVKQKEHDRRKKPTNASWVSLVEGVTVYGLCVIVPSMLSILMRLKWSQIQTLGLQIQDKICHSSEFLCWHVFGMILPEPEPKLTFVNFAPDTYLSDIYVILSLTLTMAFFRVLLVHWLVPNSLAPKQMEALVRCKSIHLLSSEYKQSLTPRETPKGIINFSELNKKLEAEQLTLPLVPDWNDEESSEVEAGDNQLKVRTEKKTNRRSSIPRSKQSDADELGLSIDTPTTDRPVISIISMSGGFLEGCGPGTPKDQDDDADSQQHFDIEEEYEEGRSTTTRSQLLDHEKIEEGGEEQPSIWKRSGSTASLAAAAAAAVQEEDHAEDYHGTDSSDAPAASQRLFAAPKYATAVFRLVYCTVSCTMAWYLFKDADFWPPYVGGHGTTAKCWDLSGSLALAKNFDSDFDRRNTVLRRFFLMQASYHLHSGAFHVASVVLLYFLKEDAPSGENKTENGDNNTRNDNNRSISRSKRNLISLLQSLIHPRALLQHSLSLIFLSVSYVFSSLRRLGAIGMFALDMSSWALHLLQTCLNAPAGSFLSQPKVIRGVWLLLVCPTFLYFRFWVWPMVGYSAMVESERWLAQLESALVPGSARWFRRTFQLWMGLWMGFHAIHFKRLVFHPHVQRITKADGTAGNAQPPLEKRKQ